MRRNLCQKTLFPAAHFAALHNYLNGVKLTVNGADAMPDCMERREKVKYKLDWNTFTRISAPAPPFAGFALRLAEFRIYRPSNRLWHDANNVSL